MQRLNKVEAVNVEQTANCDMKSRAPRQGDGGCDGKGGGRGSKGRDIKAT